MSYPDHGQPSWLPPGAAQAPQYPAQYPPQQPPAAGGRGKIWMIPVAAGLGLVLMGTTVWAASGYIDGVFGGPRPDTVLPASSFAYYELDFKPSGGQIANYAQFVPKLPDVVQDELDGDGEDPLQPFIEDSFDYLDYDTEVKPWLGKRFGGAAWESDAAEDGEAAYVMALAVTDEDAAVPALEKVEQEEDDVAYEVRDGFALIAPSDEILRDLEQKTESEGTLDGNETYTADLDAIGGGNLASAWVNLEDAQGLVEEPLDGIGSETSGLGGVEDYPAPGGDSEEPDVKGRLAMGLRIEADYVEVRSDLFDFSVGGVSTADIEVPEPSIEALGELPDDTVMAIGGGGLDEVAKQAWEQNKEEIEGDPEFGDFEQGMNNLGIRLPKGFTDLLGTQTAIGVTGDVGSIDFFGAGEGGGGTVSFQYRATGGDTDVLERLVEEATAGTYGTPPGVSEEGGTTVIASGSSGTGKLGDDPVYTSTMDGLGDSNLGVYMDLRAIAEDAGESGADQWGALGASVSYDGDGNITGIGRWAPSNT